MTIYSNFRRRFSSNAASSISPTSSHGDCRHPTLPAVVPVPAQRPETGPSVMIEQQPILPLRPVVRLQRQPSFFVDGPDYQDLEDGFICPLIDDTTLLHDTLGSTYPLERQPCRFVHFVNELDGPPTCIEANPAQEMREKPIRRLSKQVIGMSRQASVVGRHARALPGNLGRRASRLLRINTAQDVVRPSQRVELFDEKEWHADLGHEVTEGEHWRESMDKDYREVE